MRKTNLKLVAPTLANAAVASRTMPRRPPNAELRPREYLTPTEVDQLMVAAKGNRHGHRDMTMILITYRHGFRASEVCDLRWSQIDLDQARLHVRRVKRGTPSVHPLQGDELRGRPISGTATYSTLYGIQNWPRIASMASGSRGRPCR
jgi:integrase